MAKLPYLACFFHLEKASEVGRPFFHLGGEVDFMDPNTIRGQNNGSKGPVNSHHEMFVSLDFETLPLFANYQTAKFLKWNHNFFFIFQLVS